MPVLRRKAKLYIDYTPGEFVKATAEAWTFAPSYTKGVKRLLGAGGYDTWEEWWFPPERTVSEIRNHMEKACWWAHFTATHVSK